LYESWPFGSTTAVPDKENRSMDIVREKGH
jgi:hypothetical protein